jgi:hypothetical protein
MTLPLTQMAIILLIAVSCGGFCRLGRHTKAPAWVSQAGARVNPKAAVRWWPVQCLPGLPPLRQ